MEMSGDPKTDLISAILAMDSYNRGYGSGITELEPSGTIGTFTIGTGFDQTGWTEAGFYGIAYKNAATGQIVISYRGTDANFVSPFGEEGSDLLTGYGLAVGDFTSAQAQLAVSFYRTVAVENNDPFAANISTTGLR